MNEKPNPQAGRPGQVVLDGDHLGDPVYERGDAINKSTLTFYGEAADYVGDVLSEARHRRTVAALVDEFATHFAAPTLQAVHLKPVLEDFAQRLLDSSAVDR